MSCAKCPHFNKQKKQTYKDKFRYGCNVSKDGYTWWTSKDYMFEKYGCSLSGEGDVESNEQMDIFDFLEIDNE